MVDITKRSSEVTIDNRPPITIEESFHMLHIRCIDAAYNYLLGKPINRPQDNTSTLLFPVGMILGAIIYACISNWDIYIKKWFL